MACLPQGKPAHSLRAIIPNDLDPDNVCVGGHGPPDNGYSRNLPTPPFHSLCRKRTRLDTPTLNSTPQLGPPPLLRNGWILMISPNTRIGWFGIPLPSRMDWSRFTHPCSLEWASRGGGLHPTLLRVSRADTSPPLPCSSPFCELNLRGKWWALGYPSRSAIAPVGLSISVGSSVSVPPNPKGKRGLATGSPRDPQPHPLILLPIVSRTPINLFLSVTAVSFWSLALGGGDFFLPDRPPK